MPTTASTSRRHRASRATGLLVTVGLLLLVATAPTRGRTLSLTVIRSEQSALAESIRREALAAVDRARHSLMEAQLPGGLWRLDDNTETVFPVLAFRDPDTNLYATVFTAALTASTSRLLERLSQPWPPATAAEAAATALATDLTPTTAFDPRLLARLSRVRLATLPSDDAALLLLALEHHGIIVDGGWPTVVNAIRRSDRLTPDSVAIAAIGRLRSAPSGSGEPGDDVRAHLRWLNRRLALDPHHPPAPPPQRLTPEAACFLALLTAHIPRQTLFADSGLPPVNWRNTIAHRLLAQQRFDPATGRAYWEATPGAGADLRATTYAVMTLVLLAE